MIKCKGCGASMIFDPEKQMLVCAFCGTEQYVEKLDKDQYYTKADMRAEDPDGNKSYDATVYSCPNCGGELLSYDETAATFCSFCGESVLLEKRLLKQAYPSYIIPFSKTKEDCSLAYKKKLRGALFAPDALKKDAEIAHFRGIYMPYWTYSGSIHSKISEDGFTERRVGNYVTRKTVRVEKDVRGSFEGSSYDAASDFDDELSMASGPFDLHEARPFDPAYLSGFYADVGDVSNRVYGQNSLEEAKEYFTGEIEKDPAFYKNNITRDKLKRAVYPIEQKAEMGLFPVWFLAFRTRDKKRVSYAVVNGQTGKVAADLPVDPVKYALFSLLLALPIFLILNLFLTLSPVKMLLVSMFLCVISILLLNLQVDRTFTRENNLDDLGIMATQGLPPEMQGVKLNRTESGFDRMLHSTIWIAVYAAAVAAVLFLGMITMAAVSFVVDSALVYVMGLAGMVYACVLVVQKIRKRKREMAEPDKEVLFTAPKKMKMRTLAKPIGGLVLAFIIYIRNPAQDVSYYTAAAVMLALIAWSVFDIIEQHNLQTTRKLPQFKKRGGAKAGLMILLLALSLIRVPAAAADEPVLAFEDAADLLTDTEEAMLKEHMAKVLTYGSVGFATTAVNPVGTVKAYAQEWYVENIGYTDGVLLLIDMDNREIIVHSMDRVADVITGTKAEVITDNIYKYASHGDFYGCAAEGFDEIAAVLRGEKIAQPMKYLSNAFLALILAFLINFVIIRAVSRLKAPAAKEVLTVARHYMESTPAVTQVIAERTYYDPIVRTNSIRSSGSSHSAGSSRSSYGGHSSHSSGYSSHSSSHSSHSSSHSGHSSSHHTSSGSHKF